MLSQDDRRRLEEIERGVRDEDPEFASRLATWEPRREGPSRLWAGLTLAVGVLGMVVALLALLPAVLLLALVATTYGAVWLRVCDRRDRRTRIRPPYAAD